MSYSHAVANVRASAIVVTAIVLLLQKDALQVAHCVRNMEIKVTILRMNQASHRAAQLAQNKNVLTSSLLFTRVTL